MTQTGQSQRTAAYSGGLTGKGQVVGVGDSGLDHRSCFFAGGTAVQVATGGVHDSDDGKVKQYVAFADNVAGEDSDHGTHVSGSVAGYAEGQGDQYKGIAYDAQLAFFDIGIAGGGLITPRSLYDQFFPPAYNAGARIHTNSWGVPLKNSYDLDTRDVDQFMYDNQDFLVLFAAGNEGQSRQTGNTVPSSVGSPATNKNGLSVGASSAPLASMQDELSGGPGAQCISGPEPCQNNFAPFSSYGPLYDDRVGISVGAPGFFIMSARSSADPNQATCQAVRMAGTSMATPVTAGGRRSSGSSSRTATTRTATRAAADGSRWARSSRP